MNPRFLELAIAYAKEGIHNGYGPFGAVVVKDGEVIGRGVNRVTKTFDPTAHAEITAIREACALLKTFSLKDCEIYASCEPCPMCLGAIYWSRLGKVYYGATREDAHKANFDDHHFYEEIKKPPTARAIPMIEIMREESLKIFDLWKVHENKTPY